MIERLVADMRCGTLQPVYRAPGWPDVHRTPVPRWDLIDLRDYVAMPVQFSRGCPFDCEFCDIVVMNGRIPRTKAPGQLVRDSRRCGSPAGRTWFSSSTIISSVIASMPKNC